MDYYFFLGIFTAALVWIAFTVDSLLDEVREIKNFLQKILDKNKTA